MLLRNVQTPRPGLLVRERRAQRWAWCAVICLTTLAAVVTSHDAGQFWITQVIAVFILSAAWLPSLCAALLRVFDPFNPRHLSLLIFGLEFGLYPLYVLNGGMRMPVFDLAAGAGIENHYFATESLAALGLVSYLLGYRSRMGRRLERILPRPRPLDRKRVKSLSIFLFVSGYLGAIGIFAKEGGLAQFLANREEWRAGGLSGSGIFLMAASLWLPAAALLPMLQDTRPPGDVAGRGVAARFALLSICLIPVCLLGFRTLIVIPFLQCIAILHYLRARVSVTRMSAVGLLLAILMTLYGLSRENVLDLSLLEALRPEASLAFLFFRTPGTDTVATVLSDPRSTQSEYFSTGAIEAATILIPRGLWPDKPLSWGEQYTTRYFADYLFLTGNIRDSYGGVNPTVIGYLYVQIGVCGVALGMFFIGAVSKTIYRYGLRYAGPNTSFLLFILLWPLPIMAVEAPQNALNQFVITLVCVWGPLSYWAAPRSFNNRLR